MTSDEKYTNISPKQLSLTATLNLKLHSQQS